MADPTAVGMVLATLVDRSGKPVRGGAAKGQLYVTSDEIAVVRPPAASEILERAMTVLLLGSIVVVLVNLFVWRSPVVLWAAVAAQAVYWVSLPKRRRELEPRPLDAGGLEAARAAGRVALRIPAREITRGVAPEPPRTGFRKPARFEMTDGALEIYLSPAQYAEVAAAIGRPV
jgi:hypothetical protein